MPLPRVCLLMPFLNEERQLPAVLASISAQRFDHERLFLIAVDDGSTDCGRDLVRAWLASGDIAGRIVRAGIRSIPHALNTGLAYASPQDLVVRLDAHTLYAPEYVASIVEAFANLKPDVWCVGGAGRPAPTADFGRALHAALFTNPMGFGPADYRRDDPRPRAVASVYLGAWRPGVLQRLGGFDELWRANEDAELAARVRRAGGRVVRIPAECRRIITKGPGAAVAQWLRYGFWRAQTVKRYPEALHPRHLAPALALGAGLLLALSPARRFLILLGALHAGATLRSKDPAEPILVSLASTVFFPALQSAYACGLVAGLLTPLPRPAGSKARDETSASQAPARL